MAKDDWFDEAEARERFDALLLAGLHTPSKSIPKLARDTGPTLEIHKMTTDEMKRIAAKKAAKA